ncbi:hypothetical protein FJTKL_03428 [Diaporthe vaccinii]|uniref:Amine oxidase n=1 Tax=Diaporthe vaccinii TaxID=105482 RepID=A0ABR4F2J8_9PEZI
MVTAASHPLDPLSSDEVRQAARVLVSHLRVAKPDIRFKVIDLYEPAKDEVLAHLHHGRQRPNRRARVYYQLRNTATLVSAVVNINSATVVRTEGRPDSQGPVDWVEYEQITNLCNEHPEVLAEIEKLKLPPGDHYSIPLPLAPIFDVHTLELVHLEKLPMGLDAEVDEETQPWTPVKPVEYSAELLGADGLRKGLKPLQVVQPEGPSFAINQRAVSWQKWTFQLGWSLREGPILHDVRYDDRPLFYRVSMSEMTVPYGDPRSTYHRKQAFDLGDSGFGLTSNSLALGCDCLGLIAYFDGLRVAADGTPVVMPNVPGGHDLDLTKGRVYKILNTSKMNAVSGRPLGYKLHAEPSQMLMMGPDTFNCRRGLFATRPVWVTRYRDHELWAAGEFTNQSRGDTGLAGWAARDENTEDEDVVLWHSFGLTHVTRPEDFPVMPNEKLSCTLKPTSFFDLNPSNDVPRSDQRRNKSQLHQQAASSPASCYDPKPSL